MSQTSTKAKVGDKIPVKGIKPSPAQLEALVARSTRKR